MKIRLTDSNGSLFAEVCTWSDANVAAKSVFKRQKWSDLYYFIEFDDNQEAYGSIDLEPCEFHRPHQNELFTWHLKTFWGNCAKVKQPSPLISKDDIKYFQFLLTKLAA
jgi:hypothetical protein